MNADMDPRKSRSKEMNADRDPRVRLSIGRFFFPLLASLKSNNKQVERRRNNKQERLQLDISLISKAVQLQ